MVLVDRFWFWFLYRAILTYKIKITMKIQITKKSPKLLIKKKIIKNYSKSMLMDSLSQTCPIGITSSSIMY